MTYLNRHGIANYLRNTYGWNVPTDQRFGYAMSSILGVKKSDNGYGWCLDDMKKGLQSFEKRNAFKHHLGIIDAPQGVEHTHEVKWEDEMPDADMDKVRDKMDSSLQTEGRRIIMTESQFERLIQKIAPRR